VEVRKDFAKLRSQGRELGFDAALPMCVGQDRLDGPGESGHMARNTSAAFSGSANRFDQTLPRRPLRFHQSLNRICEIHDVFQDLRHQSDRLDGGTEVALEDNQSFVEVAHDIDGFVREPIHLLGQVSQTFFGLVNSGVFGAGAAGQQARPLSEGNNNVNDVFHFILFPSGRVASRSATLANRKSEKEGRGAETPPRNGAASRKPLPGGS
jgi:hypothetical protein